MPPCGYGANAGEPVDWNDLFDGYRSTVDWPACTFWRGSSTRLLNAKVVLLRPADRPLVPELPRDGLPGPRTPGARARARLAGHDLSLRRRGREAANVRRPIRGSEPRRDRRRVRGSQRRGRRPGCRPSSYSCSTLPRGGSRCASSSRFRFPRSRSRTSTTATNSASSTVSDRMRGYHPPVSNSPTASREPRRARSATRPARRLAGVVQWAIHLEPPILSGQSVRAGWPPAWSADQLDGGYNSIQFRVAGSRSRGLIHSQM